MRMLLHRLTALAASAAVTAPLRAQVAGGADSVTVRAVAAKTLVHPGDQVPIAVLLDHAKGYHSWPHVPVVPPQYAGVIPIATDIIIDSVPPGAQEGELQWPEPEPVRVNYTGTPVDLLSYSGRTIVYLPITLAPDQPVGVTSIALHVRLQSCDERICYPPRTVALQVPLRVVPTGEPASAGVNEPELFEGFGLGAYRERVALRSVPAYINVFGWSLSFRPEGGAGLIVLLLLAGVGGTLLNFTPCVLPLIPIKILGLQSAAGTPSRLRLLGGMMGLGVVTFWLILGGAIAFVTGFDAISSLFQTGWFAPLVGVIVALAALAMLRGVSVRLPQAVYRLDVTGESVPGSFAFGVMTAILSTPCTAPFMAGAAAWAVLQRAPVTLATFAAIGLGMAFPYMLLSAWPTTLRRIPRVGPGSVLVKQVIGLLMLAVAAFFIGSGLSVMLHHPPEPPSRAYWWVVAFFVAAACAWFGYQMGRVGTSRGRRLVSQGAAVGLALVAVVAAKGLASHGPIDWVPYTPERFTDAVVQGHVIVLDFTAEWCLNCKALESGVLHKPEVVAALKSPQVIPMRVDLTSENPAGQAKLKELGWVGIPLLAVFGSGVGYDTPILYDSYTPRMVLDAVTQAAARLPAVR